MYIRVVVIIIDGNIVFIGEGNDFIWLVKIVFDGIELWF